MSNEELNLEELLRLFKQWMIDTRPKHSEHVANNYLSWVKRAIKLCESIMHISFEDELRKALASTENLEDSIRELLRGVSDIVQEQQGVDDTQENPSYNTIQCINSALNAFLQFLLEMLLGLSPKTIIPQVKVATACYTSEDDKEIEEENSTWLGIGELGVIKIDRYKEVVFNRLRADKRFGGILAAYNANTWMESFWDKLIVLTRCGIHHVKDLDCMRVSQGVLYVKPKVYAKHPNFQNGQNAKDENHYPAIDKYGFVEALSYDKYGYIRVFEIPGTKTAEEKEEDKASGEKGYIPHISIDHCPALSIVFGATKHPEFDKVISRVAATQVNTPALIKETEEMLSCITPVLMERRQNSKKNNLW